MHNRFILILLMFLFSSSVFSQQKKVGTKKDALMELSTSLEEEKPDDVLARDYERLAKEQADAGEYAKAEENLEKAKKIYQKLKDKERLAIVERELAKIQEIQNKTELAIASYQSAGKSAVSAGSVQQKINVNDAQRLMNKSNPEAQTKYIQENIELLGATDMKEEQAVAYQQMAEVNIALNQNEDAISNYENALKVVEDKPAEVFKISKEIVSMYAKEQRFDDAIEIGQKLVEKAQDSQDSQAEIEQLFQLSMAYSNKMDSEKSIDLLEQAYSLAIKEGNTLEAKRIVDSLVQAYGKTNDTAKILGLYADFNAILEPLILSDTALLDSKIYQNIEERIFRLERERELKDELLKRKNLLNTILIVSIVLILTLLAFMVKALIAVNKKNKKIALQSLRREMNPHFIFNSLNSVNHFIAQNNELEANKYLSSYSKLMRNTMENSNKDFIPLSVEIAQLKEYLQLEHMRFSDKFTYEINVDPELDTDAVLVPNMLIQPQLENAIWHGLRYTEKQGLLLLSITTDSEKLNIIVEDNGIGIKQSKELKTARQKEHKSRGMTNTQERIGLLNDLYHTNITIKVTDKEGGQTGVIVIIEIPLQIRK